MAGVNIGPSDGHSTLNDETNASFKYWLSARKADKDAFDKLITKLKPLVEAMPEDKRCSHAYRWTWRAFCEYLEIVVDYKYLKCDEESNALKYEIDWVKLTNDRMRRMRSSALSLCDACCFVCPTSVPLRSALATRCAS